ncbi:protein still life, isoforms C/SIF type 2-like isoform X1 [Tubulanus polymorphus]|uniref:protein still life, isoforms C/SIF type 2-like isoform X1 n=1 Tax=Tubulanus polymorphus TaxID=672921 RepID=UPI003DA26EFB
MLQSLPISPNGNGDDCAYHEFEEKYELHSPVTQSQPVSPTAQTPPSKFEDKGCRLHRTHSLHENRISHNNGDSTYNSPCSSNTNTMQSQQGIKLLKANVEQELRLRNVLAKDTCNSYPDSGISGMTSGSVMSGDTRKSSTLPHGSSSLSTAGSSSSGSKRQGPDASPDIRHGFTSSEMSEDSDDEGSDSSIHTQAEETQNMMGRQGAIRKAGWLIVKNWLVHKKRKLELAPKRTWKKYWVCLKGTVLLFFLCDDEGEVNQDAIPRHLLVIEGGIAQAIPEHPKRENIFALSTAYGDAYLFQAPSQTELNNWIASIHSACASSYARQHGKDNTLKLLRSEIQKLDTSIDMDCKMRKMAELQLTVVTDPKSRQAIIKQILQWEENLEKLYIEQYRLRCYMSSLQGSELPNPKTLLSNVSKNSKVVLGRLGVFTVTSFHGLVCARSPNSAVRLYPGPRRKNSKNGNSLPKTESNTKSGKKEDGSLQRQRSIDQGTVVDLTKIETTQIEHNVTGERIFMPNKQHTTVPVNDRMIVSELVEISCNKKRLNPRDHFLRMKTVGKETWYIPDRSANIKSQEYDSLEIYQKVVFQTELVRPHYGADFGFQIEAELAEDSDREDELRLFVTGVNKGSLAENRGLQGGDEILVINGKVVADLDMVYIESLLQEGDNIRITVRSCRSERPYGTIMMEHADVYIDKLVCPPPPTQTRISDKAIGDLIVPAPQWGPDETDSPQTPSSQSDSQTSHEQIGTLTQPAEQLTEICRATNLASRGRSLSDAQKLRKVIVELIETERGYVKDLTCLIERYLEPLKAETFLSHEEIEQLFGNIQEIVQFQRLFLQSLEEAVEQEPEFLTITDTRQFHRILFSIGGSFLYYANHFKLYSSFCASHSKAQKVLNPETNALLRDFLRARNPKQQHSATLESYLIKPIQRILKYPLLLQQLKHLTSPESDEFYHLSEALRGMETVAEHINEMQKIYDEYGAVFHELMKLYKEAHPNRVPIDLNIGELQMYGIVEWLNVSKDLGKIKKGQDLVTSCFVFKTGVVLLCKERIKQKKKSKQSVSSSKVPTPEIMEFVRFQTLIPVQEVQVRSSTHDVGNVYWWELIHLRSGVEGRPEKVYQLANSTPEAKNDFMRTIRQIIRESVRKMTIPPNRPSLKMGYMTLEGKRCEHHQNRGNTNSNKNPRAVAKQRTSSMERHSMGFDEAFDLSSFDVDFRSRSKTVSNLINMDPGVDLKDTVSEDPSDITASTLSAISTTSSTSFVSNTTDRGSAAKLLFASNNPLTYSSHSSISAGTDSLSSPIWKPRQQPVGRLGSGKGGGHLAPSSGIQEKHPELYSSPYGDYTGVIINDHENFITPAASTAFLDKTDDTEC